MSHKWVLLAVFLLSLPAMSGQDAKKTGFLLIDKHGIEIIDESGQLVGYCRGWVDSIKECKPSKGHTRVQMEAVYSRIAQKTEEDMKRERTLTTQEQGEK